MSAANFGQAAPPWHMWAATQMLTVPPTLTGVDPVPVFNQTLARASYGRTETWRFLFHAVIVAGGTPTDVGEGAFVEVRFDLLIGMGRSAIKVPSFVLLQWDWGNGNLPRIDQPLYTTSTRDSVSIPAVPLEEQRVIDQFVAQDITIVANAAYFTDTSVTPLLPVKVDVSAQIAPNAHVRPDWYRVDATPSEQFPGGEIGAR